MSKLYHIISDGSCDLPEEEAARKDITIVPFYVGFDEEEAQHIRPREFYRRIVDAPQAVTTIKAPTAEDYEKIFRPLAGEKTPILCITIAGDVSSSAANARAAAKAVTEKYPDARIEVVDSGVGAILQALFVGEAVRLRDEGLSLTESVEQLKKIAYSGQIFFTGDEDRHSDHKLLRCARWAYMDRSSKRNIRRLVHYIRKQKVSPDCFTINIGYGYNYGEAANFRSDIIARLHAIGLDLTERDIPIYRTGAVHGAHIGAFSVGVAVLPKTMA